MDHRQVEARVRGPFAVRNRKIALVDKVAEINGSKLPSNGQVIGYFLYQREKNKGRKNTQIAAMVFDEIIRFYQNASNIPTKSRPIVVKKINDYHSRYIQVKTTRKRGKCGQEVITETQFVNESDDLFDISTNDALDEMEDEEAKNFLHSQRQPGRPGKSETHCKSRILN